MADFPGTAGDDNFTGTNDADTMSGLGGNDELRGGAGDDIIDGGDGDDLLNGDTGGDRLIGGTGNDIFFIDDLLDVVVENAGEGFDLVYTSANYGLSANVERAAVTDRDSIFAIAINGNALNNEIWGNDGANYLNGDVGADILRGLGGDDVFLVDNAGDVVVESAGGGADIVFTTVSHVLADHVERLSVNGFSTTFAVNLTGNTFDNEIWGNDGTNQLDGGAGADILQGLGGNDVYLVDNSNDLVIEHAGGGSLDLVLTSVAYQIADHVERLFVNGQTTTSAINLIGNALDNEIRGNNGDNIIDGGAGEDIMSGFSGDDIFIVDNSGDVVSGAAGLDTVFASADFALTTNDGVERLGVNGFTTTYAINLTGNSLANEIWGNDGANIIDGGNGVDRMTGFDGDDTYFASVNDVIIEDTGGGFDTVRTNQNFTLPDNIERLTTENFTFTNQVNLTGNDLDNEVIGNDGVNRLDGRGGADILQGFRGTDDFAFTTALGGGNVDQIVDFTPGIDRILLDDAVFTGLAPGPLPLGAYRSGTAAQDADDRILYDSATGALYFDADGNGSAASAIQFATVSPGLVLTPSDFAVI